MTQNMKVALLFLLAVAGLVGIISLLTGGVVGDAATLHVRYNFAGGVQTGTPVRVAGIQVGKVRKITFLGGDPSVDEHVDLTVDISKKALESVRKDSNFYVNMAGIIGERYIEISTGSKNAPQLTDGDVVRGVDPPRLDQLISQGYAVAGEVLDFVERNKPKAQKIIDTITMFMESMGGDDPENISKMFQALAHLIPALDKELPPVLRSSRPVLRQMRPIMGELQPLLADARELLGDENLPMLLDQLVTTLNQANGTLGRADLMLDNLAFVDENWVRHFLQSEGVRAYVGFGTPVIPKGSRPVPPPPLQLLEREPALDGNGEELQPRAPSDPYFQEPLPEPTLPEPTPETAEMAPAAPAQ